MRMRAMREMLPEGSPHAVRRALGSVQAVHTKGDL